MSLLRALSAPAVLLLLACASTPAVTSSPSDKPAGPAGIDIRVDRRIELLTILFKLAGGNECQSRNLSPYEQDVQRYFSRHQDHPAVATSRRLAAENGISYSAPTSLAVYLDEGLEPIRPLRPLPEGLDERWADVDTESYLAQVQAFAKDTDFDGFLARHRSYFEEVERRFQALVEKESVIPWFDGFFGPRTTATYILVPGLQNGGCNFGATARRQDGREQIYQAVGLEKMDAQGLPSPGEMTLALLVHEMAHAYANPIVDAHGSELAPGMAGVFKLVEKPMREQAYPSWKILGQESLVRATTQLYLRDQKGTDAAARDRRHNEGQSFPWIGELADVLSQCRSRQGNGPVVEACIPDMAKFFDALAQTYEASGVPRPPFRGPINAVLSEGITMVAPSLTVAPQLSAYVSRVRARFFASAPFEEVTPSSSSALGGTGLVLYGSPASNPVIGKIVQASGWKVSSEEIVVGGQGFKGKGLVLIACRAHLDDPTRGVLVYTSVRARRHRNRR